MLSSLRSLQEDFNARKATLNSQPIDNIALMKKLQRDENLTRVELGSILIELLHQLYVMHQVATVQIFHHEKEIFLQRILFQGPFALIYRCLEAAEHLGEKRALLR